MSFSPPLDMDQECVFLCIALNKLPGIETFKSRSGNGRRPFQIWFCAEKASDVAPICFWSYTPNLGFPGWKVTVDTDFMSGPVFYVLEGPNFAYAAAHKMATLIEEWLAGLTVAHVQPIDVVKV